MTTIKNHCVWTRQIFWVRHEQDSGQANKRDRARWESAWQEGFSLFCPIHARKIALWPESGWILTMSGYKFSYRSILVKWKLQQGDCRMFAIAVVDLGEGLTPPPPHPLFCLKTFFYLETFPVSSPLYLFSLPPPSLATEESLDPPMNRSQILPSKCPELVNYSKYNIIWHTCIYNMILCCRSSFTFSKSFIYT